MGLLKSLLRMNWDEDCDEAASAMSKRDRDARAEKVTVCKEKMRSGRGGSKCDDDCPKGRR